MKSLPFLSILFGILLLTSCGYHSPKPNERGKMVNDNQIDTITSIETVKDTSIINVKNTMVIAENKLYTNIVREKSEGTVTIDETGFIVFTVNPSKDHVEMFWKDDDGQIIKTFETLKTFLKAKGKELRFAMNGGMFMANHAPLGLYIEDFKVLTKLNTRTGSKANFYIQPNGVFYLTKQHVAHICKTADFKYDSQIEFATQSGPMLVINGEINPKFVKGSEYLCARNGVGILPTNEVVFVISERSVNFYDFAQYFQKLHCTNALFLDGCISAVYLPEEKYSADQSDFGVIIGVTN